MRLCPARVSHPGRPAPTLRRVAVYCITVIHAPLLLQHGLLPALQVKTMFALSHGGELHALGQLGRREFAGILRLWEEWLRGRPTWSGVMAAAAAADYAAVRQGLASCLE